VILRRAHRALSNLNTWLHGTHRATSPEPLQVYLDEFVFLSKPDTHGFCHYTVAMLGFGPPEIPHDLRTEPLDSPAS
jgi:hypothetical protein